MVAILRALKTIQIVIEVKRPFGTLKGHGPFVKPAAFSCKEGFEIENNQEDRPWNI